MSSEKQCVDHTFDSTVDTCPACVAEKRCPKCLVSGGRHGLIHIRHGNGGGHNERCPLDPSNQQPEERDCYHPRSCTRCDYLGEPCGSHHPGRPGHERCVGARAAVGARGDESITTDPYGCPEG